MFSSHHANNCPPLVGRTLVLGQPNALGHYVIVLNNTKYVIQVGQAQPGDRVKITKETKDHLIADRVD